MGRVSLLSGGIDSILAALLAGTEGAIPLFVDYGQHSRARESACAGELAKLYFGLELIRVELPWYARFVSPPLCSDEKALGRPDRHIAYAPFRNSLFVMIGAAIAEANGLRQVVLGSHNGDNIYPDNSPAYLEAMNGLLSVASKTDMTVEVTAPVLHMDKTEIVRQAQVMGIPFQHTWSCYFSGETPCGHCLNCNDRSRAFEAAGMDDPVALKDPETPGGE